MGKIFKYTIYNVLRSRWAISYFLFFVIANSMLLYFSSSLSRSIVSIMNLQLAIIPLMSILFGAMYYYNSREFIELLLSQPIKRSSLFAGQFLGLSTSLALSFLAGILVAFLFYQTVNHENVFSFSLLLVTGVALTYIFAGLAYFISIKVNDRIKGFGLSILVWLILAVLYDGIILLFISLFNEYPLDNAVIALSISNPIDLARILILLKLDISALMGFTGAVFHKFLGSTTGMLVSAAVLLVWIFLPFAGYLKTAAKKDF